MVNLSQQTQLVSPAWNQARPWLSGTWLMEAPAAFLQEAGGAPDQQQLAALVDLRSVPAAEAEALLVDDLLTVMMGQVRVCVCGFSVCGQAVTWLSAFLVCAAAAGSSLSTCMRKTCNQLTGACCVAAIAAVAATGWAVHQAQPGGWCALLAPGSVGAGRDRSQPAGAGVWW